MVKPKTGWINLTIACNMRCGGCYVADAIVKSASEGKSRSMPTHEVLKLIDQMTEMGCDKLVLLGGEPTIHPGFMQVYKYARHEKGLLVRFATNGRTFSNKEFSKAIVEAGLVSDGCTFSMHAPNAELAPAFIGSVTGFIQFEQGLKNLIELGVYPNVNIVLAVAMLPHVREMMKFLQQLGFKKVSFNLGSPGVEGDKVEYGHCIPPDQLAEESWKLYEYGNEIGLRAHFLYLIPFCLLDFHRMKELVGTGRISSGCQISSGRGILFNKDGDLIPCNHMQDKVTLPKKEIQDILQQGKFDEFWNSDGMRSVRASTSVYRSDHCRTCGWYNMCGGGCALFWAHFDPRQYIRGVNKPVPEEEMAHV